MINTKKYQRVLWYSIASDVNGFLRKCDQWQKKGDLKINLLKFGVNLCNLPTVDGYCYVVALIDSPRRMSQFLCEVICRHGCFETKINDQGREFVHRVNTELNKLTGVEQRVISAHYPELNGLIERRNKTMKTSLVKVLVNNPSKQPNIIEGMLFVHHASPQSSTKYSPFMIIYDHEPVLPSDVKYNLKKNRNSDADQEPFDFATFDVVLSSATKVRASIIDDVSYNNKKAQEKQKRDFDRRHCQKPGFM